MEFLGTIVNTKLSIRCSNLTQRVALERSLSVPKPDDFSRKQVLCVTKQMLSSIDQDPWNWWL